MSSVVNTPRKSEAESSNRKQREFNRRYVDDVDGNIPRGSVTASPQSTTASPPTKKPAVRKRITATPKSTAKSNVSSASSSQDSPSSRKSGRIAAGVKRTAKAMDSDDADNEQSTPTKKRKTKANTTFEAPPGKIVEPAAIRKSTGRFTPINSQFKPAKKIEKRPTELTNTKTVLNLKLPKLKIGVKRPANADGADAETNPKPAKSAKRTQGAAAVPAAEAASDLLAMNIGNVSEAAEANKLPAKGKRKGKAAAAPPVKRSTDGDDSSKEKPADATNDTAWNCANRGCTSGQTWHDREVYGRKVISNFLGRNKKQTHLIHKDVWHVYCRKDYQRKTYAGKQLKNEVKFYVDNLEHQLVRIQIWRPEAKFKVHLMKDARNRTAIYYKEAKRNGEAYAVAAATATATTKANGKPETQSLEERFPIKKLIEFDDAFCNDVNEHDFDYLATIIQWIRDEFVNGNIKSMPPMEFLINEQADGEVTTDPATNWDRWVAYDEGRDYDTQQSESADAENKDAGNEDGGNEGGENDGGENDGGENDGAGNEGASDENAGDADAGDEDAGPSGTQNTPSESDTTEVEEVEASEAGDAITEQVIDEGDIPDYESYLAETPVEDTFHNQLTDEGYDDDGYDNDGYDEDDDSIKDGGYDYSGHPEYNGYGSGSESESDSDDGYDEPPTPPEHKSYRNSFGYETSKGLSMGKTVGLSVTNYPCGDKILSTHDLNAYALQKAANAAISPLSPTAPAKPFESVKEVAVEEIVYEAETNGDVDTKPAGLTAGIEVGAKISA